MLKIWISEEPGNDKVIALIDNTLYKCNPPISEVSDYEQSLRMRIIPDKKTLGIPLSYIKEFRHEEGKKYFQVFFGHDSEEHFRITDNERLQEIFAELRLFAPNTVSGTVRYTWLQAGKRPLIAIVVASLLFIWTLYIAIGMEAGSQYEVVGRYDSFAGLVVVLASLGVVNVVVIFGVLIAIATFSFIRKAKNPPVFHQLVIKR
jgi:hypothetical protein